MMMRSKVGALSILVVMTVSIFAVPLALSAVDCYHYTNSRPEYYAGSGVCAGTGSGCTECVGGGGGCVTDGTVCIPQQFHQTP